MLFLDIIDATRESPLIIVYVNVSTIYKYAHTQTDGMFELLENETIKVAMGICK